MEFLATFLDQEREKAKGGEEDALAPITDGDESDESVVRRDRQGTEFLF